jgi:hypothetical protein
LINSRTGSVRLYGFWIISGNPVDGSKARLRRRWRREVGWNLL